MVGGMGRDFGHLNFARSGIQNAPSWVLRAGGLLPMVDADIAADQYWVRGVGPVTSSQLFLVSRASTVYVQSSAGLLIPVGSGQFARSDLGALIEEGRTNILIRSNDFANFPNGAGVSFAQNIIDPAGVLNSGWTLTQSGANGSDSRAQCNTSITNDGSTYTCTARVQKQASVSAYPSVQAQIVGGTGVAGGVVLNPVTGAFLSTGAAANAQVLSQGNYWLVSFSLTNNSSGNVTLAFQLYPAYAASLTTVKSTVNGGANGFAFCGVEGGPFWTSYIPTTVAGVGRSANDVDGIGALSVLSASGAVRLRYNCAVASASATRADVFAGGNDGANNNRLAIRASNGDGVTRGMTLGNGTTTSGANSGANPTAAETFAVLAANWTASNGGISVNGSALDNTVGTPPLGWNYQAIAPSLGRGRAAGAYLNRYISRLTFWDAGVSDSLMPGLSV